MEIGVLLKMSWIKFYTKERIYNIKWPRNYSPCYFVSDNINLVPYVLSTTPSEKYENFCPNKKNIRMLSARDFFLEKNSEII